MADLQNLKAQILADGTVDDHEVELIRRELYADGQIDQEEIEFLIALRNEARAVCPAFEDLFFQALKQNVLTDGSIDAEEAAWLRQVLFADGVLDARETQFLADLQREAARVSPEFRQLCDDCLKGQAAVNG
jgi:uncharacterized tellurite resistance protein B-like protein